ncbi:MAG TPA: hypothetical protein DCR14_01240 [Acidimicrobiaceae bacterium]|nr:hypothetical protein [Acidimicrobiaceae bacterium]
MVQPHTPRHRRRRQLAAGLACLTVLAAACSDGESADAPTTTSNTRPAEPNALPAEPQEISFTSAEGVEMSGLYYPAAINPAPVVVLFHWAYGDRSDWHVIAPWLQNRGLANPFPITSHSSLNDRSWFPIPGPQPTYGVFIASYRGCSPHPDGCPNWTPDQWLADSHAIITAAASLPGVDADRIVTMGAGIGADGATLSCAAWNETHPGACDGVLALAPGSYLGEPFGEAVAALGAADEPVPVWCMSTFPQQVGLCDAPGADTNPGFRSIDVMGDTEPGHLLVPAADPSPLQLLLDLLAEVAPV